MKAKKKFRMLGITSGIGSMMVPAVFDEDLKDKVEVLGNQEWRPYYNCGVFEKNFKAPYWDKWENVPLESKSNIDFVFGHPECGNYSILNRNKKKLNEENDIRYFIERIAEVKPKFFLMDDLYKSLGVYDAEFYAEMLPEYDIFFEPISNYHYGNIQKNRKRFFIVGSLKELKYTWVPGEMPDHGITVKDKIGDLPTESDIESLQHFHYSPEEKAFGFKHDTESREMNWEELAGKFRNTKSGKCLPYMNKQGIQKIKIGSSKLHWEDYSHVLYGGGGAGQPGAYHPLTGYPLTVRERARIQGFPDDFSFELPKEIFSHSRKRILHEVKLTGKAMPVEFCRYALKSFMNHLEKLEGFEPSAKRFYGNIPELILVEKEKYCRDYGYSDQKKACEMCWNKKCTVKESPIPFEKR